MLTIGMTTFNALKYTKMCIQAMRETVKSPFQFLIVDGGSTDGTREWIKSENIPHIFHADNFGGAVGMNDLLENSLKDASDMLLVCGNDTIPYPGAVDEMVAVASMTSADWVWAHEVRVSDLAGMKTDRLRGIFDERYCYLGDPEKPFDLHTKLYPKPETSQPVFCFTPTRNHRNFTLIKKSLFDKIGYADVNYWPAGYYEDPDYCRRAALSGCMAVMADAWFWHFWSRTIFEGGNMESHNQNLSNNQRYYAFKWGGLEDTETNRLPFGDKPLNIFSRSREMDVVQHYIGGTN